MLICKVQARTHGNAAKTSTVLLLLGTQVLGKIPMTLGMTQQCTRY
jgi:hypothetical protein